ncbi:Facilitated trehalose transporter Tret1 [Formica fusca]
MATNYIRDAENAASTCKTDETAPLLSECGQANMSEKIGISQQTLVSTNGQKAKKLPQYLAGIAATLGALAAGMVLGWTSPAGENGKNLAQDYNISISPSQFSWIGSLTTLGAGAICIPIGILTDLIGRKTAMLLMVVPFTIGWLLIIFSNSILMFYFGRFITGVSGGAFCVAAPLYTSEIAESEIRVFFFMPETPVYYLKKGNEEAARESLSRLRGDQYDVEIELQEHREALEKTNQSDVSFAVMIKSRAVKKGLVIAYGLMLFQQMSGVNSIIFYSSDIFTKAGSSLPPAMASIIVGAVQVISVFFSTLVVDKLGRRILLLTSIVVMFLMTFILGIYFYCITHNTAFDNLKWFALIPLCVFLIMFSFGFGPIPWMMMPEIFAPKVKGIAGSSACLLNWLAAFLVTKFYNDMVDAIQSYGTFWIFSLFCAIGIAFVYFLVPETKGKTLDQIQRELND